MVYVQTGTPLGCHCKWGRSDDWAGAESGNGGSPGGQGGGYRWRQGTSGNTCNPTLFSFGHVMLPWCQPLTLNSQMHFSKAPTIFHPLRLLTYCSPCQQCSPRNLCMFKYIWCVLQDLIKVPLPSYQNSFQFLSSQRFLPPLNFWGNFCSQYIIYCCLYTLTGAPRGHSSKESVCNAWDVGSRCRFNPWVRKIPWRRKWQPTPVFLTGKFHGRRSVEGYSPWNHKSIFHTSNGEFNSNDHYIYYCG